MAVTILYNKKLLFEIVACVAPLGETQKADDIGAAITYTIFQAIQ